MMALKLGALALALGEVERATLHPDGVRTETDTTHTVMLGLVAWQYLPEGYDLGKVLQYVLVHDLVEAEVGDTNTLLLGAEGYAAKRAREALGMARLEEKLEGSPLWTALQEYEAQVVPEARYVRYMDKAVPKITHILNNGAQLRAQGIGAAELAEAYVTQWGGLAKLYPEFEGTRAQEAAHWLVAQSTRNASQR